MRCGVCPSAALVRPLTLADFSRRFEVCSWQRLQGEHDSAGLSRPVPGTFGPSTGLDFRQVQAETKSNSNFAGSSQVPLSLSRIRVSAPNFSLAGSPVEGLKS